MTEMPRETDEEKLGASVRYLRERAGMSQAELAKRMTELGWPWYQSTVHRLESGRQPLRFSEAVTLANVLAVPLQWLTWGGPAITATAMVDQRAAELHVSWSEASRAVTQLLTAIATAERTLAQARESEYEQAREASRRLGDELRLSTLETAVADGIACRERMEESGEGASPGSEGPFGIGVDDEGKLYAWVPDTESDDGAAPENPGRDGA